jgi:hypothetical protein
MLLYFSLFRIVLLRIYLRRNIPVTSGKELSPANHEICAEYFNDLLEQSKTEHIHGSVAVHCACVTRKPDLCFVS